jgi:hypothetical protein
MCLQKLQFIIKLALSHTALALCNNVECLVSTGVKVKINAGRSRNISWPSETSGLPLTSVCRKRIWPSPWRTEYSGGHSSGGQEVPQSIRPMRIDDESVIHIANRAQRPMCCPTEHHLIKVITETLAIK